MQIGRLFTVGHGTRPLDDLVALLRDAGAELLVDVRRFPGSRRNPQYEREVLSQQLPTASIVYDWRGDTLGGRRKAGAASRHTAWRNASFRAYADYMDSAEFRDALHALLARASQIPTAVMCAETLWWRCHRRLIADAATINGFEVVHLGTGAPQVHCLDLSARIDADGHLVYDVGADRTLAADDD